MDKAEQQHIRERNKRLKKKRKAYAREEKESVKQQKRELKRKQRNRGRGQSFFSRLFRKFKPKTKRPHAREEERASKSARQRRAKKAHQYLRAQHDTARNERRRMHAKTRPMRRRIRKAKWEKAKKDFLDFLKHPIKRRIKGRDEILLHKQIRQDIRKERIQWFLGIPSRINNSIKSVLDKRKARLQFQWMTMADPMSEFSEQLQTTNYRTMLLKTFINSLVLFVLAFWMVYLSHQMISILTGKIFSIPAVLYSYRIFWPLYTYSSLYSRQALIIIFGLGPLSSLIIAIASYRIYIWARKSRQNIKMLLLWMALHGFNLFFGAYIVGVITRTGFVYTTEWIFFSSVFDVEEIVFMIISIISLIIIGVYSTRQFIMAANSPDLVQPKLRFFYVLAQVFFPWLLGNLVLYLINYPNNPPELLLLYAASALMILPAFTNFNTMDNQMIKVSRNRMHVAWIYIGISIGIIAFVRLVVFNGISFN